jgi:hypothetical protein
VKSLIALLTATVLVASTAVLAGAQTTATTSTGFDISFPQCSESFPALPGFGVVGVNGGTVFSANKCLASELPWAEAAANPSPAFYVNTGDPGPAHTTAWPSNQSAPDVCFGANSTPCAYDFGWNAARASFGLVLSAESAVGAAAPRAAASAAPWWLDVETGNVWETLDGYGATSVADANDQAMLLGMIAYLTSVGVTSVGIYSTAQQWRVINGASVTGFAGVPVWIPGSGTLAAAESDCTSTSFTGGRVAMTQYPSQGYDGDYLCGLLNTPATAAVSVAASATFSDQLVATNNDGAVAFVQTAGTPALVASSTGLVTTSGALAPGTYVVSGTTSDPAGDVGTFSLTLEVGVIAQTSPTTASVKASGSAAYSSTITVTGDNGSPLFTETAGTPQILVSSTGVVTTSGALAAGTYSARGTVTDASGDSGTFTFSLTVGALKQRAPMTATTTTADSAAFSTQLDVGANLGPVTYVQTTGAPALLVSSTGVVTTSGALPAGTYNAAGTTSDTTGDSGDFIFTLTVTAATTTTTTTSTIPGSAPSTTTTTVPPDPSAVAVIGHAVAGRAATLTITGAGFYGRPNVTSHAGTTAVVLHDTGHFLVVRVSVRPHSRRGVFTFTLRFAHGQVCRVRYEQF